MTTETIDWEALQSIKAAEPKRSTMLDILGVSSKEVYITQAYAYFLNRSSDSTLHEKFAKIVFEELDENIEEWKGYTVLPEVTVRCKVKKTEFGKLEDVESRIDLLIISGGKAIILENKIYAGFYNPIEYYILGVKETLKYQVIKAKYLTLSESKNAITHIQICKKMNEELEGSNESGEKYLQFKEFIDHMIGLSNNIGTREHFNSYSKHFVQVNNVIQLRELAFHFFKQKLLSLSQQVVQEVLGIKGEVSSDYFKEKDYCWFHIYTNPKNLMDSPYLTVVFEQFFRTGGNQPIALVVEAKMPYRLALDDFFKNRNIEGLIPSSKQTKYWRHYYFKHVAFDLNSNDEENNDIILKRAIGSLYFELNHFNNELKR
jgi:hypothetical protein